MATAKNVVLVRAGSFGLMKADEYDEWIENAKSALEQSSPPSVVEVVTGIPALRERLAKSGVQVVGFFSRGIVDTAAEVQAQYGIKVFLLTGLTSGLSSFEPRITIINKAEFEAERFRQAVLS